MPRRIVLSCWGSYGDLFPYLGLARHLKAAGHVPVVVTSAYYRDLVERQGVAFHAMRPDIDPRDEAVLARVMDPFKGSEVVINELTAPFVRDALADLQPVVRGADLVVSHPITFAAPLAARAAGVPWLSSALAPLSFFSLHDFPILPPVPIVTHLARLRPWTARAFMTLARRATRGWTTPVRALREDLGLQDTGDPVYQGQFSPLGTLALFSSVMAQPQPDWPPNTTMTGFVFHEAHGDGGLPPRIQEFLDAGDPPIVFTLGSSAVGAAGAFYRESIAAARKLGRRALLLVGRDVSGVASQPLPPGTIAVDYVPHHAVFPRAAAIVHHGGIGTTAQALRAGRPMLVVPHAHDQPDNAFRVTRLGVARTLDARRYRAVRAAAQIDAVLTEPAYRAAAERVRQRVVMESGAETACGAILRVLP